MALLTCLVALVGGGCEREKPSTTELDQWVWDCKRSAPDRDCARDAELSQRRVQAAKSQEEYDWLWNCSRSYEMAACEREFEQEAAARARHPPERGTGHPAPRRKRSWVPLAAAMPGLVALVAALIWRQKQKVARLRLQQYERGERCLGCDGTTMQRSGDEAVCELCGYQVSLTVVRAAQVSEQDLAKLTRPGANRR